MPGPRFRTDDDKPVFNDFGKPIIQVNPEAGPKCLCCEKCEQYLQCFKRVPLAVDLAGLNFSGWIEWAQLVWAAGWQRERTGNFTGSDPDGHSEFVGRFVFHPRDNRTDCGGQQCFDDGEVSECRNYCGTHHSPYYRTIHTPGNPEWPNKKVSLFAYVTCCHVDDDPELESTGVKFGVMLQIEGESGIWSWNFSGTHWSWWHDTGGWSPSYQCCPILETDCIPWAELDPDDWSNLQNLQLNPTRRWWYNNELTPEPDMIGCSMWAWSWLGCESICTEFDEPNGECDACDVCAEPELECPNGSLEIGTVGGMTCDGTPVEWPVCVPEPIRLIDPDENYISVLGNCRPKDCTNCVPPTEWEGPKPPATTVEINFTATGGCGKTFTAIYPECLEVAEINWSFGKSGPVVSHYIRNLVGNSSTEYGEIVTLTIVDTRGCIYTYCRMVTCGCCSGASGSLSIEPGEFDCCYVLTASVTSSNAGACEGHLSSIEYQVLDPGTGCAIESFEDCECDDPECNPECGRQFLTDGQFSVVCVDSSAQVRSRVWDKFCGCAGPWNYADLPCTACEACDDFDGINMTISNTGDCADTTGCDQFNGCWNVPVVSSSEDECFGELTVPGTVVNDPAGSLPAELYLWWRIYKSGSDWLLDYGWSITVGDPGLVITGDNLGVLLSPDPLLCQAISDDFTETSASCFFCIENGVNCAIASGSC